MSDPDRERAERAADAMLAMRKFEFAALEAGYAGKSAG
jgi:hypothetical protein